jgi:hypothetical protein
VTSGLEELRVKESTASPSWPRRSPAPARRSRRREDGLVIDGTGGEPLRGSANSRARPTSTTASPWRWPSPASPAATASRVDDTAPIATSFPQFEALLDGATRHEPDPRRRDRLDRQRAVHRRLRLRQRRKHLNKVAFNLANLVGAILLLISLSVNFNLAAFVLEAAWGTIAAAGLLLAVRAKLKRSGP